MTLTINKIRLVVPIILYKNLNIKYVKRNMFNCNVYTIIVILQIYKVYWLH